MSPGAPKGNKNALKYGHLGRQAATEAGKQRKMNQLAHSPWLHACRFVSLRLQNLAISIAGIKKRIDVRKG
jgi:hypothetical protein